MSLIKKPEKDLSALCQQYDSVLSSILDKHAPVSTMTNSMDDSGNNERNFQINYRIFRKCKKTEIRANMNVFERASEDEIKKLIFSSSSKSCDLDPNC